MATLKSLAVDVEVQPLEQWPRGYDRTPDSKRQSSRFDEKGILDRSLNDLETEMRQLGARDVVLQVDISRHRIRNDGLPYQNASIGDNDPGVVLTFETDEGVQTYPCDTYRLWTENLRAIVLALESLRRVSRYGVGHGSEQYRGFMALPADVDEALTPERAARLIVSTAGFRSSPDFDDIVKRVLTDSEQARDAVRRARKNSHPDQQGGTSDHFKRVQTAADILRQHHNRNAPEDTG